MSYEIRAYRPGDEEGILASFNAVFEAGDPRFEARGRQRWRWSFLDNPAGSRVWVALRDGVVAAHYASLPIRMKVDGRDRTFGQIVDSFVLPEHRRGLKRPGLFVETGLRMLAETCGPDPPRDLVTYGWPVPEAWRIGKRFLGYELVRMQTVLWREPGAGPVDPVPGTRLVERADERADRLYARCWPAWGASAVRDARFLNWRLFEVPGRPYELHAAVDPETDEWAGTVVYRRTDWPVPNVGLIVDWLVPDDEEDVGDLLLEVALRRARADGVQALLAIVPEWSPWFRRFQEQGLRVRGTDVLMSGRNNEPVHDMAWLRDRWWYQPIDLDLV